MEKLCAISIILLLSSLGVWIDEAMRQLVVKLVVKVYKFLNVTFDTTNMKTTNMNTRNTVVKQ